MIAGCSRKTVSLPAGLVQRAEEYLTRSESDLTFSAFVSDALKVALARIDKLNTRKVR